MRTDPYYGLLAALRDVALIVFCVVYVIENT